MDGVAYNAIFLYTTSGKRCRSLLQDLFFGGRDAESLSSDADKLRLSKVVHSTYSEFLSTGCCLFIGFYMYAIDPHESLVPIFVEHLRSGEIEQVGTGIFIEFQGAPFIFTAAHVTDIAEYGSLMAPTKNGIAEIAGYMAYVDLLPESKRENDTVDIAYFRLDSEFAKSLIYYFKPLHQSRCEILHKVPASEVYSICGYPVSKARHKDGVFSSEVASYRGLSAKAEIYSELELSSESSIIVHFRKKNAVSPLDGKKINPLSPRGVSGGGIFTWPLEHELSNDWSLTRLVGIFHTYKERQSLMIGTNLISVVTAVQLGAMKGYGGVE